MRWDKYGDWFRGPWLCYLSPWSVSMAHWREWCVQSAAAGFDGPFPLSWILRTQRSRVLAAAIKYPRYWSARVYNLLVLHFSLLPHTTLPFITFTKICTHMTHGVLRPKVFKSPARRFMITVTTVIKTYILLGHVREDLRFFHSQKCPSKEWWLRHWVDIKPRLLLPRRSSTPQSPGSGVQKLNLSMKWECSCRGELNTPKSREMSAVPPLFETDVEWNDVCFSRAHWFLPHYSNCKDRDGMIGSSCKSLSIQFSFSK